ncbi:MAG: hypothetical protein WA771_04310 [Chthoniobacterales bacterium]
MPIATPPPALHVSEGLVSTLARRVPSFRIEFANRFALRGLTPKGGYEIRFNEQQGEVRTTFLARGGNPLEHIQLISRTPAAQYDPPQIIDSIVRNEEELPWVQKSVDAETGRRTVTVLPFGDAPNAPSVLVSTSASTGFVSINVEGANDLSPAEALLLAKALAKAADLAAN